jgi:hypothetical protein
MAEPDESLSRLRAAARAYLAPLITAPRPGSPTMVRPLPIALPTSNAAFHNKRTKLLAAAIDRAPEAVSRRQGRPLSWPMPTSTPPNLMTDALSQNDRRPTPNAGNASDTRRGT